MNNLKLLRELNGWTQRQVARSIRVLTDTVSRWEKGSNIPSPENLDKLAQLFQVSIVELGILKDEYRKLTRLRLEQGWTQLELSEKLNVGLQTIINWEKGKKPNPSHRKSLAALFEIPVEELFKQKS